jgi:hypothetical protein
MKQCTIYCVNTKKDAIADIMTSSTKRLKVVLVGTNITIELTRKDQRVPFIGYIGSMEFETFGELE